MSLGRLAHSAKPRPSGLTMMIDPGLGTAAFTDVVTSHGDYIDLVKFGWGTALVTRDLRRKIALLREHGIAYYFGGTLFEHYLWSGRIDDYVDLLHETGATHVEVSNGTIPLDQHAKAAWIRTFAEEFTVLSEVGFKDAARSAMLTPADWVAAVGEDLDAGAWLVVTESRESGRSGIAGPDGHMRLDVLGELLASLPTRRIMFETPTKELQVEVIRAVGPDVNVGNIAPSDVIGLETLRLGLRADTLMDITARGVATVAAPPHRRASLHAA